MRNISQNLKWLRSLTGLSQQKFADKVGLKKGDLANWELGNYNPRPEMVAKIADYYNITTDALMYENLSETELNPDKIKDESIVKESDVLYGNDPMMKDEPETPEEAAARIAALRAYIKTLRKENDELKDIIETNLKIKI